MPHSRVAHRYRLKMSQNGTLEYHQERKGNVLSEVNINLFQFYQLWLNFVRFGCFWFGW